MSVRFGPVAPKQKGVKMSRYRQEYRCDYCGVESHVFVEEGGTLEDFLKEIMGDHRKWSPECDTAITHMRLHSWLPPYVHRKRSVCAK